MIAYYFYYENGSYSKKFISVDKIKLNDYREYLLKSKDNCKSIGDIKEINLDNVVSI